MRLRLRSKIVCGSHKSNRQIESVYKKVTEKNGLSIMQGNSPQFNPQPPYAVYMYLERELFYAYFLSLLLK